MCHQHNNSYPPTLHTIVKRGKRTEGSQVQDAQPLECVYHRDIRNKNPKPQNPKTPHQSNFLFIYTFWHVVFFSISLFFELFLALLQQFCDCVGFWCVVGLFLFINNVRLFCICKLNVTFCFVCYSALAFLLISLIWKTRINTVYVVYYLTSD